MITKKTVTRWFYGGKGYASRVHAYRAKAKKDLKAGIYAEAVKRHGVRTVVGEFGDSCDYPNFGQKEINAIYAERFPHDDNCHDVCYWNDYGSPSFPWCKKAWRQWIVDRAEEMIREEEEPT